MFIVEVAIGSGPFALAANIWFVRRLSHFTGLHARSSNSGFATFPSMDAAVVPMSIAFALP